jgi:hypothetical protein
MGKVFDPKGVYGLIPPAKHSATSKEKKNENFGNTGRDALSCRLGIGYAEDSYIGDGPKNRKENQ